MNPTVILSALTEAWQEVKIQKARVILSLVGVVAAVAAMSTVMALGDIIVQANKEEIEAMTGRDLTIRISVQEKGQDEGGYMMSDGLGIAYVGGTSNDSNKDNSGTSSDLTNAPLSETMLANFEKVGWPAADVRPSVFTRAVEVLTRKYNITYYSRLVDTQASFTELTKAYNDGQFRGRPLELPEYMGMSGGDIGYMDTSLNVQAVDPAFNVINRLNMKAGRWITSGDVNQRVIPVVINSVAWGFFGNAPIEDPITLTLANSDVHVRIVGVVQAKSAWEAPYMYVPYDAWEMAGQIKPEETWGTSLLVWVDPSQGDEARTTLPSTLNSLLGEKYTAKLDTAMMEGWDSGESELGTVQIVVMIIGAIVILLGALGLLNVAIVTVRQRIREIGIRRAVGASARRVFFAVFLESVVATFVAGVLGVALAILIVRFLPLESLGIYLQETPAFPMKTALAGLGISTAIGALCGIIPAFAAVRVKPIDAIRY